MEGWQGGPDIAFASQFFSNGYARFLYFSVIFEAFSGKGRSLIVKKTLIHAKHVF
jgi:hypothetical protein